jgi:membrane associated rhomboid family serine protease
MRKINWIILLCILSSIYLWFLPSNEYEIALGYLAFSDDSLLQGKVWTPITALFLHADPMHLIGNMVFLFVFGNTLEKELGSKRALSAFFIGGILSFLLSTYFYDPATPSIGASAAIFTLSAIVMLVKPLKFSFLFLMPQGLVAIIYFMYNIVASYLGVQSNVAYISHVIGFIIGILLGIAWSKKWKINLLITFGLLILYYFLQIFLVPIILRQV